jgi:hypothetical protein
MMISFLLFGIEEIGLQIEEPFGILALDVSGCMGGLVVGCLSHAPACICNDCIDKVFSAGHDQAAAMHTG